MKDINIGILLTGAIVSLMVAILSFSKWIGLSDGIIDVIMFVSGLLVAGWIIILIMDEWVVIE